MSSGKTLPETTVEIQDGKPVRVSTIYWDTIEEIFGKEAMEKVKKARNR